MTPANVGKLARVWTFRTGEAGSDSEISGQPVLADGVLYATTPRQRVIALWAANGFLKWRFDPWGGRRAVAADERRGGGLAIWGIAGGRRVFQTAAGALMAIEAATGEPCLGFGAQGRIELPGREGPAGAAAPPEEVSPPAVWRDLVVVEAGGRIAAYDARTGERRWIFDTKAPTGGAPVGGSGQTPAVDAERGLVFAVTGPPRGAHWGGHRGGANWWANCVVALDAATGARRWHFQMVHHDLWHTAPPAAPALATVSRAGVPVPAVVQVTRTGHTWVLHRETGEPLFPWREVVVPGSNLEGEVTAATQPLPELPRPWARQVFDAAAATGRTPEARAAVLAQLGRSAPGVLFQPPDVRDTLGLTGMTGGAVAVDAAGVLYVAASEAAWILQMHPKRPMEGVPLGRTLFLQLCAPCHGPARTGNAALGIPSLVDAGVRLGRRNVEEMLHRGRGLMPPFAFLTEAQQNALIDSVRRGPDAVDPPAGATPKAKNGEGQSEVPYTTAGFFPFRDPDGFPALRPPWGSLLAIDLNTGAQLWRRPLGETPGLPPAERAEAGAENQGGPLVTATGVVFVAATCDEKIRAFCAATGALLWEQGLPAGGYATPVTYTIDGRQFVVIACGGVRFGTKPGDAYVAFALPEN